MTPELHGEQFRAVDQAEDAEPLIRFLDLVSEMAWVREYRALISALLDVRPGEVVADVGCGTGEVAAELPAIGVDASSAMVAEARRRHPRAEFVQARASKLPFESGSVDAYRAERLYQHLDDPAAAAAEAYRVLRPGGRAVVCEQDWESLAFASDDRETTRRLCNGLCDSLANGWIGRHLPGLLGTAGFVDVRVSPQVLVSTQLGQVEAVMVDMLAAVAEAAPWAAEQRQRADTGTFLMAMTMFVVSARKGEG